MEELMLELKKQIVEQLNIQHVKAEEIGDDQPLFGEGLGLDSIDALELIVLLQQKHGVKVGNPSEGPAVFKSIRSIAEYITAEKSK